MSSGPLASIGHAPTQATQAKQPRDPLLEARIATTFKRHTPPPPRSTANLWLAFGDETGPFEDPHSIAFHGCGLLLARPQDLADALNEDIAGKTVRQRMGTSIEGLENRLRALGDEKRKELGRHHVREAWPYFSDGKLTGHYRLDATPEDPVLRHLLAAFRWLSEHPRLISIGIYGNGRELFGEFWKGSDPMAALGALYGRALAMAKPFLGPGPRIRMLAGRRSERVDSEAIARAGQDKGAPQGNRQTSSMTGGNRTLLEAMENEFWETLEPMADHWPVPNEPRARHTVFSAFTDEKALRESLAREDSAASGLIASDRKALGNLADLACSLMSASRDPKGDVRIDWPTPIGPNVRFFSMRDVAR